MEASDIQKLLKENSSGMKSKEKRNGRHEEDEKKKELTQDGGGGGSDLAGRKSRNGKKQEFFSEATRGPITEILILPVTVWTCVGSGIYRNTNNVYHYVYKKKPQEFFLNILKSSRGENTNPNKGVSCENKAQATHRVQNSKSGALGGRVCIKRKKTCTVILGLHLSIWKVGMADF